MNIRVICSACDADLGEILTGSRRLRLRMRQRVARGIEQAGSEAANRPGRPAVRLAGGAARPCQRQRPESSGEGAGWYSIRTLRRSRVRRLSVWQQDQTPTERGRRVIQRIQVATDG